MVREGANSPYFFIFFKVIIAAGSGVELLVIYLCFRGMLFDDLICVEVKFGAVVEHECYARGQGFDPLTDMEKHAIYE
jgi:hypothetical protein